MWPLPVVVELRNDAESDLFDVLAKTQIQMTKVSKGHMVGKDEAVLTPENFGALCMHGLTS